jgi:hypothetical protein
MHKPALIRTFDPDVLELDGDLTRSEVIELIEQLRFGRQPGETRSIVVDRDIRDLFLTALQRR